MYSRTRQPSARRAPDLVPQCTRQQTRPEYKRDAIVVKARPCAQYRQMHFLALSLSFVVAHDDLSHARHLLMSLQYQLALLNDHAPYREH